VGSPSQVSMS